MAVSGTGPQIYAENIGVGSDLSPREMMMPSGSVDSVSLRSFFTVLSVVFATPWRAANESSACAKLDALRIVLAFKDLRIDGRRYACEVSQNDTA